MPGLQRRPEDDDRVTDDTRMGLVLLGVGALAFSCYGVFALAEYVGMHLHR